MTTPDRHTAYHMLIEAFQGRGCPVCGIVQGLLFRHLDLLIHENVNDIEFRNSLRRAGGFCNTHAWWLITRMRGAALGSAIMYRDVLNTLLARTIQASATGSAVLGSPKRKRSLNPFGPQPPVATEPHTECPACITRTREEEAFLSTWIVHGSDAGFVERYGQSDGMCFVHLDQALTMVREPRTVRALLDAHVSIVERLIIELDEFQRKTDYRFSEEEMGHEADSWKRAIELINGKDGLR